MALETLREAISQADREIVQSLCRRFDAVEKVAAYKQEQGLPTLDIAREAAVMDKVSAQAGEALSPYVRMVYRAMLDASRMYQQARRGEAASLPEFTLCPPEALHVDAVVAQTNEAMLGLMAGKPRYIVREDAAGCLHISRQAEMSTGADTVALGMTLSEEADALPRVLARASGLSLPLSGMRACGGMLFLRLHMPPDRQQIAALLASLADTAAQLRFLGCFKAA